MHSPFTFEPLQSQKANNWLRRRAEHLATLNPSGQRVFLKSCIALARQLPLSTEETAFDKSAVIITVERWLDEVREAA